MCTFLNFLTLKSHCLAYSTNLFRSYLFMSILYFINVYLLSPLFFLFSFTAYSVLYFTCLLSLPKLSSCSQALFRHSVMILHWWLCGCGYYPEEFAEMSGWFRNGQNNSKTAASNTNRNCIYSVRFYIAYKHISLIIGSFCKTIFNYLSPLFSYF